MYISVPFFDIRYGNMVAETLRINGRINSWPKSHIEGPGGRSAARQEFNLYHCQATPLVDNYSARKLITSSPPTSRQRGCNGQAAFSAACRRLARFCFCAFFFCFGALSIFFPGKAL